MTIGDGEGQADHDRSEEVPGLARAIAHASEVGVGGQEEIGPLGAADSGSDWTVLRAMS